MRFVVDGGHHPSTAGKRTPDDSMRESHFNFVVADYVKEELLTYEDVEVLFTHDDKRDVPLKERTDKANKWDADALVSIHANAFGNGTWNGVRGIETFSWSGHSPNGDVLASEIQRQMMLHTKHPNNRGHKRANFHMLREFKRASALVECGFMTNKEDAALLKSDAYRRTCAKAIVAALVSVYGLKKKPTPKPAPKPSGKLYKVQVGAFGEKSNADRMADKLKKDGYPVYIVQE